ncbi:Nrap protein [Metschnikowia bicuspidata var. bicuspidata NRRL YB-4993]|uniref:U3 small nucleolar RNA-associated protein 22 n=1 Tax=Metschnikowia bicuspidata var. bicuspidata NRRL YB-4993 TaxID=869754 RepID=A0A1A0HKL5_9ASCO|nr:Nrap protein [Metschnikowia bicuspidata var. bicuspidata NRRL YB-4993]OBA24348.1 Nrap protein [Metschnikowia bicuspidata var. bicuspidata NRRL YB-4993]
MAKRLLADQEDVSETGLQESGSGSGAGAETLADLESQLEDENMDSSGDESAAEKMPQEAGTEAPAAPVIHGRATKKQKKQITAQEVQMARETAELFKSNIFKLQIDELMSEIKIKDLNIVRIEKVLHRLHDCIGQVPSADNLTLADAEKSINGKKVAIPFPDPRPSKVNYRFGYLPPADVSLVGSFGLKTGIAQAAGSSIDISLTMPLTLFLPKDYLNYRALYKRSFYLAYLADQLIPITRKNGLPVKISYTYLNDDVLCPVLTLESIKTDNDADLAFHKTKFSINLLVALPLGVFDSKKLLPDRNCIRVQSDAEELPPTPHYNSSVLSLTTYDYYLKFLYANKKAADAFKDACRLGRLWLQQREFGSAISKGGFGHFEFAILLSALLSGGGTNGNKILLHGFSSYQLFKGAIKYLATMDLTTGYLSFSSSIGEGASCKFNPDAGFNTPTLFDKSIKLNILWKMTKSSYQELRQHAIHTLGLLNDVVFDRFDAILLQKVNVSFLNYDLTYDLEVPEEVEESFGALEKISFVTFDNFVKHKLHSILKIALDERVASLSIRNNKVNSSFPLAKRKPSSQFGKSYTIGLQLNPDECDKLVTKGPNDADDEPAAKFRSFWGAKVSLRKFKDGTIQHCVVWTTDRAEPLVSKIIKHCLSTHFHSLASDHLHSHTTYFNKKLPAPLTAISGSHSITSTANYTTVKTSFENLSKVMYNLELPLSIKSMMPASAALRNTTLLQPVPFAVGSPDFWCDAVLQFETSNRWPDEIIAMEKTKAAFLLKISSVLNKESTYKTFISRDESIPFNNDITLLNVLTPDGFGFRFRVLSERDEVLYLRAVRNSDTKKALVQNVYFKFNQKYLGSIKHTRTISILSSSFPYYSPTVRLFKQWLDAHTLLSHFTEELVELIALKPFVDPAPYTVPNSVEKGFLQILSFVANWNWKDDPLILDLVKRSDDIVDLDNKLSERLTAQAYQVVRGNFDKIRASDPSGMKTQFFVGTRDDPSGILWSSNVTLPIASRLTALARAATLLTQEQGIDTSTLELLFTPALNDFDFVIKMKGNHASKFSGISRTSEFKNLSYQTYFPEDIPSTSDLTPVLVDMLNKRFGSAIIFSARKCAAAFGDSGNMICGVFVPSAATKKKFRVSLGVDVKPTGEGDEVVINKESILDQVKLLGGDAIKSIKFRK